MKNKITHSILFASVGLCLSAAFVFANEEKKDVEAHEGTKQQASKEAAEKSDKPMSAAEIKSLHFPEKRGMAAYRTKTGWGAIDVNGGTSSIITVQTQDGKVQEFDLYKEADVEAFEKLMDDAVNSLDEGEQSNTREDQPNPFPRRKGVATYRTKTGWGAIDISAAGNSVVTVKDKEGAVQVYDLNDFAEIEAFEKILQKAVDLNGGDRIYFVDSADLKDEMEVYGFGRATIEDGGEERDKPQLKIESDQTTVSTGFSNPFPRKKGRVSYRQEDGTWAAIDVSGADEPIVTIVDENGQSKDYDLYVDADIDALEKFLEEANRTIDDEDDVQSKDSEEVKSEKEVRKVSPVDRNSVPERLARIERKLDEQRRLLEKILKKL